MNIPPLYFPLPQAKCTLASPLTSLHPPIEIKRLSTATPLKGIKCNFAELPPNPGTEANPRTPSADAFCANREPPPRPAIVRPTANAPSLGARRDTPAKFHDKKHNKDEKIAEEEK